MNKLRENPAVCCVCDFFKKISKYTVKGNFDMDVGLYNEDESEAVMRKTDSGDINCKLLNILAMIALMSVFFAAVGAAVSMLKLKNK